MNAKKESPGSVAINGQGKLGKSSKGNNLGSQLQLPWFNLPLQGSSQIALKKAGGDCVLPDSLQLCSADKKMQKITEQRDKNFEQQTQVEFSLIGSVPPLPPVNELLAALMSDAEDGSIKELPESFIGRGDVKDFKFIQLKKANLAYLYQVQASGPVYYEIFERRINTQFRNVSYPNSNAFGIWAWTTADHQKAMEMFDAIKLRKGNIP